MIACLFVSVAVCFFFVAVVAVVVAVVVAIVVAVVVAVVFFFLC